MINIIFFYLCYIEKKRGMVIDISTRLMCQIRDDSVSFITSNCFAGTISVSKENLRIHLILYYFGEIQKFSLR